MLRLELSHQINKLRESKGLKPLYFNGTVLGYARTVWKYELKENGAYYYSGDDNGPDYMAINDIL